MRKGLFFWSGIFFSILIAALILVFLGHEPEERDLARAIPQPSGDGPYLLAIADGKSFELPMSQDLPDVFSHKEFPLQSILAVAPIAARSERTAILADFSDGNLKLMASIKLPFEDLKIISRGKIPESWKDISSITISMEDRDTIRLTPSALSESIVLKRDGGLLLASDTDGGLQKMISVIREEVEPVNLDFNGFDKKYDNFLRIEDGGILSQTGTLYGLPTRAGRVSIFGGWYQGDEMGKAEWKLRGLKDIFPASILDRLHSVRWDRNIILPDPVLFAAAVNMPSPEEDFFERTLKEYGDELGVSSKDILELAGGPVVLSVSGRSKILLFSLPGVSIQFAGRKEAGRKLVRNFWTNNWRTFTPSINEVEGFDTGGSVSIPMSLAGVANDDLAVLALMESKYLKPTNLSGKIPLLSKERKSLMWFFVDGPELSSALEKVARAGSLAQKLGADLPEGTEDIDYLTDRLRKMGKISILIPEIDRGTLQWEK